MIFISHRGNLVGPNDRENSPEYLEEAADKGFSVEADLRVVDSCVYLGHDEPRYRIGIDFITVNHFIWHAKDRGALLLLSSLGVHYFWHQEDDYALTSRSLIITHPKSKIMEGSIVMLPELRETHLNDKLTKGYGICSDNIEYYKRILS